MIDRMNAGTKLFSRRRARGRASPPARLSLLLVGLWPLLVPAAVGAAEPEEEDVEQAEDACELDLDVPAEQADACEAVFGDAAAREANRTRRERLLEAVDAGAFCIDIVFAGSWSEPEPIDYQDLTLVETFTDKDCPPTALVRLEPATEPDGCPAGFYLVQVDDALGEDGRVLAILDGVLLVESGGELRYLKTAEAAAPVWRMTWHPPWRLSTPRPPARHPPARRAPRGRYHRGR